MSVTYDGLVSAGFTFLKGASGAAAGACSISMGNLKDCDLPEAERGKSIRTNLSSTAEESKPGFKKPGEINLSYYWNADTYDDFKDLQDAGTTSRWKATWPMEGGDTTASLWLGEAWVQKVKMSKAESGNDDALLITVTLAVTGDDTFTEGG